MFVADYYQFRCQIGFKRIGIRSVITGIFDRSYTPKITVYRFRLIGTSLNSITKKIKPKYNIANQKIVLVFEDMQRIFS